MSWQEYVAIAAIILSIAALVVSIKYSRPQAKLAKMNIEEKRAERLSEHREELIKGFFGQVFALTGPGSLDENAPLQGIDEYSNKLELISSNEFKSHWENGLKHVMVDDKKVYEMIKSLADKFSQLRNETNNLLTLIKNKIKSTIEDPGLSTYSYPIPPGKIYMDGLIDLLEVDWNHSLRVYSTERGVDLNCVASCQPSETFKEKDDGRVEWYNSNFAQTSPQHSAKDLFDIVWSVEKDPGVLEKIVAIRNSRYDLKKDLTEIHKYATKVINMIELKNYNSKAECCTKL